MFKFLRELRVPHMFMNDKGCWGGGGPDPPDPTPLPDPAPTPTPSDVSPQISQKERAAKLRNMRFGLASTITNRGGARGLTGSGADLSNRKLQGKKTLGE